jgi:hypothetical protein
MCSSCSSCIRTAAAQISHVMNIISDQHELLESLVVCIVGTMSIVKVIYVNYLQLLTWRYTAKLLELKANCSSYLFIVALKVIIELSSSINHCQTIWLICILASCGG